jgi:hypothetical protein
MQGNNSRKVMVEMTLWLHFGRALNINKNRCLPLISLSGELLLAYYLDSTGSFEELAVF